MALIVAPPGITKPKLLSCPKAPPPVVARASSLAPSCGTVKLVHPGAAGAPVAVRRPVLPALARAVARTSATSKTPTRAPTTRSGVPHALVQGDRLIVALTAQAQDGLRPLYARTPGRARLVPGPGHLFSRACRAQTFEMADSRTGFGHEFK